MERCKTLAEYAQCVAIVREYIRKNSDWRKAIRDAIDECIEKDILKDFLLANKSEVVEVLLTEYNEQKTMAQLRRESEQIGKQIGKQMGMDCAQAVITKLIEANRLDELKMIRTDEMLLYKLAKEFGIEE